MGKEIWLNHTHFRLGIYKIRSTIQSFFFFLHVTASEKRGTAECVVYFPHCVVHAYCIHVGDLQRQAISLFSFVEGITWGFNICPNCGVMCITPVIKGSCQD